MKGTSMKEKQTTRIGHPPVFLVPFLIVFLLLLGVAIYYAMANRTFSQQYTKKGTPFTLTDLDMIESRPPMIMGSDSVPQEKIPKTLSKALASDFDARPCSDFTQGMFTVNVLALSENNQQALVGLGCGGAGQEKAIFIQRDGTWEKLGAPHFMYRHQHDSAFSTQYDLMSCVDTEAYTIDRSIAPLCYDGNPANPSSYINRLEE